MADSSRFRMSDIFLLPEHEDLLRALVAAMGQEDGIDGYFASDGGGVELWGTLEDGFDVLGYGIIDGGPNIRAKALRKVTKADRRFGRAVGSVSDDTVPLEVLVRRLLEPGTHATMEYFSHDRGGWYYSVSVHHADGRMERRDSHALQRECMEQLGVSGVDKASVAAARAVRPAPPPPEPAPTHVSSPTHQETPTMQRESHTVNGQTFELVHCPPGTFTMGSPEDEADRDDIEVQHEVTLTRGFALGVVPVTQALWEAVTGENPSEYQDGEDASQRPVENVSWFDAVRFCNALSAKLGLAPAYTIGEGDAPAVTCDFGATGFRLPTEAEWEYAARSGGDAFVYAGSDELAEVGWYDDTEHEDEGEEVSPTSIDCPQPVAGKRSTRWGVYDLSGNVWEWCWDVYGDYAECEATDPTGVLSGPLRVRRGGSWYGTAVYARAAYRDGSSPGDRGGLLGLRLSRTIA